MAARVGHRLAAAGLVERIFDLATEALEEFKRRDPDLRMEGVYVARDEQTDAHGCHSGCGMIDAS